MNYLWAWGSTSGSDVPSQSHISPRECPPWKLRWMLQNTRFRVFTNIYSAWILWIRWLLHWILRLDTSTLITLIATLPWILCFLFRDFFILYYSPCNLFFNSISHLCISVLSCIQTIYKHPWFTSLRRNVKDLAPPSNDLHISWVLSDLRANIHALLLAVWETHIADQAHVTVGCED